VTAPNSRHPSRRDRLRPFEYVVISAVIAVFIGFVVMLSTRQVTLALIFAGVTFIVTLVVIAMLALAAKPDDDEKIDLTEQDHQSDSGH
jgi:predicted lysophospholipase L1 biosynthesis ABC-type transport system permease subunit